MLVLAVRICLQFSVALLVVVLALVFDQSKMQNCLAHSGLEGRKVSSHQRFSSLTIRMSSAYIREVDARIVMHTVRQTNASIFSLELRGERTAIVTHTGQAAMSYGKSLKTIDRCENAVDYYQVLLEDVRGCLYYRCGIFVLLPLRSW